MILPEPTEELFRIFLGTGISGSWGQQHHYRRPGIQQSVSDQETAIILARPCTCRIINNDGNEDLLVGSYAADVFGTDSGGVYVYNNFNSASSDLDARFGPPYFYIAVQQQFAHGITGGRCQS